MKIFTYNPLVEPASWARSFAEGIRAGALSEGISLEELSSLDDFTPDMNLLITCVKDVDWSKVRHPAVVHVHSSCQELLSAQAVYNAEYTDNTPPPHIRPVVNSRYAQTFVPRASVLGFPYSPMPTVQGRKEKRTILINQRFATEKLSQIETLFAIRLVKEEGYRILRTMPLMHDGLPALYPDLVPLFRYMKDLCGEGFELSDGSTPAYMDMLARAEFCLTTTAFDTLSVSVLDGIHAGCIPIVPNALAFPEFVSDYCRYSPWAYDQVLAILERFKDGQRPTHNTSWIGCRGYVRALKQIFDGMR